MLKINKEIAQNKQGNSSKSTRKLFNINKETAQNKQGVFEMRCMTQQRGIKVPSDLTNRDGA